MDEVYDYLAEELRIAAEEIECVAAYLLMPSVEILGVNGNGSLFCVHTALSSYEVI